MKKKVFIPAVLLILVTATGAVILLGGREREPSPQPLKVVSDNVDVEMKDILYTETGDDQVKWEIKAAAARYMKGANLVLFEDVRATLLMKRGEKYVLSGDRGEFHTDTKDIKLAGRVKILTERGDTFKADHLHYANAQRKITADGPVSFESGRMQVNGEGLRMNIAKQELTLLAKVRARIE